MKFGQAYCKDLLISIPRKFISYFSEFSPISYESSKFKWISWNFIGKQIWILIKWWIVHVPFLARGPARPARPNSKSGRLAHIESEMRARSPRGARVRGGTMARSPPVLRRSGDRGVFVVSTRAEGVAVGAHRRGASTVRWLDGGESMASELRWVVEAPVRPYSTVEPRWRWG
jgi:hypothetical protein